MTTNELIIVNLDPRLSRAAEELAPQNQTVVINGENLGLNVNIRRRAGRAFGRMRFSPTKYAQCDVLFSGDELEAEIIAYCAAECLRLKEAA